MSRIIVYHGAYGCDTGCCGHWIEIPDTGQSKFSFDHCSWNGTATIEEKKQFAQQKVLEAFGPDHVADLDWNNCIIDDGCWQ